MGEMVIRKLLKKENMALLILGGLLLVVIAMPIKKEDTKVTTSDSASFYVTQPQVVDEYSALLEKQLEEMLSKVSGVGRVEVMITLKTIEERDQILYPQVEGVLVTCQGAGRGTVNADITEAVQALFNLAAHKVKVLSMNSGG